MDDIQQATEIKFFDASSRMGRVRYLAYPWGLVLMLIPVFILAGITFLIHMAVIGALLFIAAEIFALVMAGVFVVRRLHDFGWSGWWSLIYWVLQVWSLCLTVSHLLTNPLAPQPLGNFLPSLLLLVFFLIMVLIPGTQGANRFGPMPPPNSTWVVVGAWSLLLIPFLLGIIAAISIPAYQDYMARSQTSEGIQLAGGAEVGVSEYYQQNKSWPDKLDSVYSLAAQQPAGRYVESVTGHSAGAQTYGAVATMKSEGVNRNIAGKSVEIWTTDGGKTWHCGPGGADPVDRKFLIASCRDADAP
jgi:uncharacterized membrane protein YhaH (DUF805 family)/Tfp pilus assembly major pilin PilA